MAFDTYIDEILAELLDDKDDTTIIPILVAQEEEDAI